MGLLDWPPCRVASPPYTCPRAALGHRRQSAVYYKTWRCKGAQKSTSSHAVRRHNVARLARDEEVSLVHHDESHSWKRTRLGARASGSSQWAAPPEAPALLIALAGGQSI